jgi:hypothetical protein
MPVTLITESNVDASDVDLLTQDGELTLEAQAINGFLTHADFSDVFANPASAPHVVEFDASGKLVKGDKALAQRVVEGIDSLDDLLDGNAAEFLLGEHVAALVDQNDLVAMFEHYVDTLPDGTLEEKAMLAAVGNLFGITEKFARGSFRKMASKGKPGHAKVARMMLAMLNKGAIKRSKDGEGGYMGGGYEKGTAYKKSSMVKAAAKQKIAKYKKANVAKQKKAAMAARVKVKEGVTPLSVFGFGVPVDESHFQVSTITVAAPKAESTGPKDGLLVVENQNRPGAKLAALSEGARLAGRMAAVAPRALNESRK